MRASLILFASAVALARPKWHELESYTFEQYLEDFGKQYEEDEYLRRKLIFNRRVAAHREHNAKDLSWKNGVNKFTDWSDEERKSMLGYDFELGAQRRHHNLGSAVPPTPEHVPELAMDPIPENTEMFSWINQGYMNGVTDQGRCGGCWAFASKTVLETRLAIATRTRGVPTLAPQHLISCAPDIPMCGGKGGCGGSTPELAYEYISKGNPLWSEYVVPYAMYTGTAKFNTTCPEPYQKGAFATAYTRLPSNQAEPMRRALASGPVALAVAAKDWADYETGIFTGCNADKKNMDLDHAVTLTGMGTDEKGSWWEIRNSWGADWGEAGTIRLYREMNRSPTCYNDTTPRDGEGCLHPPSPPKVTVCGECGVLYDPVMPTGVRWYNQ